MPRGPHAPARGISDGTPGTWGPVLPPLITVGRLAAGPGTAGLVPDHDCPDPASLNGMQIWLHDYLFHRPRKWYTVSMTETTTYNWDEISGHAVERLSKPKIRPVPPAIVRQAQRSVDADPAGLKNTLVLEHRFSTEDEAAAFCTLMRSAGQHTQPPSSILVRPDPDKEGDPLLVRWQARKRPGRTPAATPEPVAETAQEQAQVPVAAGGVPF